METIYRNRITGKLSSDRAEILGWRWRMEIYDLIDAAGNILDTWGPM